MRALLVFLALLVSSHVAAADSIGLLIMGDVLQTPTRDQGEKWIRSHGQQVISTPLPKDAIKILQDCFLVDDPRCSSSVIDARANAPSIITIRVEIASKKEKDIRLTIDWFTKGHAPVTARRTCENCTDASLRTTLDAMLTELAKNKPGFLGKIKITSEPAGIPVLFDNETLGVTPLERDVAPGPHKARLIRDGHMGPEQDVTVKASGTTDIVLEAPPVTSPTETPAAPVHHSRAVPATMIGLGGAAIATGAVLAFVIHKEPNDDTHFYKDYKTPGFITAGAGAVVAVTGLIIILATPNHSGPTVSPTADGGATISWSGRF